MNRYYINHLIWQPHINSFHKRHNSNNTPFTKSNIFIILKRFSFNMTSTSLAASFSYKLSKRNSCKKPILKLFVSRLKRLSFPSININGVLYITSKTLIISNSFIKLLLFKTLITQSRTWFNSITLSKLNWSWEVNSKKNFRISLMVFICIG